MIYFIGWVVMAVITYVIMLLNLILEGTSDDTFEGYIIIIGGFPVSLISWPLLLLVLLPTIFVKFLKYYKNKTKVVKK